MTEFFLLLGRQNMFCCLNNCENFTYKWKHHTCTHTIMSHGMIFPLPWCCSWMDVFTGEKAQRQNISKIQMWCLFSFDFSTLKHFYWIQKNKWKEMSEMTHLGVFKNVNLLYLALRNSVNSLEVFFMLWLFT